MSETPKKPRSWHKVAYVALPVLALLLWVNSALQFREPRFSFLPKKPQSISINVDPGIYSLASPVGKTTDIVWTEPKQVTEADFAPELIREGYVRDQAWVFGSQFVHPNLDNVILVCQYTPSRNTTQINFIFMHLETRGPYCVVKNLKDRWDRRHNPIREW